MVQAILVSILFIGAVFYLGRFIVKQFQAKSACSTGCGKCSVAEVKKPDTLIHKG
jgi:hypothetical protein